MKKINLWIVLLLTIVTFGIYGIVWIIKRRAEMIRAYKQVIPHWWWLIAPLVVFAVVTALTLLSIELEWSDAAITALSLSFFVILGAAAVISIVWMWKFSKAAAYITGGRVPAGWSLALYLLTGGLLPLFLQYYFNRAPEAAALKKAPAAKPSGKFIALAIAAMILSLGSSAAIAATGEYGDFQDPKLQQYGEQADRLFAEYNDCIDQLNTEYAEVTLENEAAYNTGYDACEEIRFEQHEAVKKYNDLLGL